MINSLCLFQFLFFASDDKRRIYLSNVFIHSEYFYSASSSPLLLRGDLYSIGTMSELTRRSATCRQLRVKYLPRVPAVYVVAIEWDLNPRPSGVKAPNLPLSHQRRTNVNSLITYYCYCVCYWCYWFSGQMVIQDRCENKVGL